MTEIPHDHRSDLRQTRDSGMAALALVLRYHGIPADPLQLEHEYGTVASTPETLVRAARRHHVKARSLASSPDRLAKTPLPAIAQHRDGRFFIIARHHDGQSLIQDPRDGKPIILSLAQLADVWNGTIILITRRARLSDLTRKFDITWFLAAMAKYRRLLSEVLIASFVLQLLGLASPLFFQVVVDKVLAHRSLSTLDVLTIGLLAIALFETALGGLRQYLFAHTTSRIDVELGSRLFRHLLALPMSYFDARRTGDSVARVREVENIRNFITSSALTLVIDLVFTIVFIAVMLCYSGGLTAIVLLSLPVYAAITILVSPVLRQHIDERFRRGAENQAFLVETVTGIETAKSMAVEPQMQRRWEDQLAGYVSSSFDALNLSNWGSQAIQLVSKATTAALLYAGAHAVMDCKLTVGELVAFNMLAGRVAQPVLRLAQLWQDFQQTRMSIERLGDILNTPPEPTQTSRSMPPALAGHVGFERVTFRYRPDGPAVLTDISLAVPAGQMLGIVGASGSGKSTLAKLIQRFHIPENGRVLIDGIDLALIDAAWLRRQVGVVLQDNILFNRSVRENIALSDPGMPMERVIEAAKLAGAHDFILELPNAYDTVIGERGTGLSGGQRQRIAIARALVNNPRLLILDEATSALDTESEEIVQRNLRKIAHGRTVVIIAHRLSAVRQCDRIISLDKGRLIEDGTHDGLMQANGRYAAMVRHQAGLNAL